MREMDLVGSQTPSVSMPAFMPRVKSSICSGVLRTRGVMNTTSSVRVCLSVSLRKSQPRSGMSPRSGTLVCVLETEFCVRPPRTTVWPLCTETSAPILRVVRFGNSLVRSLDVIAVVPSASWISCSIVSEM